MTDHKNRHFASEAVVARVGEGLLENWSTTSSTPRWAN